MEKLTLKKIKKELEKRGIKNITKEDIYYWSIIISIERLSLGSVRNRF